jgi:leader peptidase (prepilin peptidase)/N-methyltransferase
MFGAFFGWKAVILILFLSSIFGTVCGLTVIVLSNKDMKYAIPYGPFLSIGAIIYLFVGNWLIDWYLGLF